MRSLAEIARALGGEISGGQVLAPGPGHSSADRSLAVRPVDGDDDDGFILHSHAGDDPIACKDYVREKLGMPAWKPNGRQAYAAPAKSPRGEPDHVYDYPLADGTPFGRVLRWDAKGGEKKKFIQYRWEGGEWRPGGIPKPRPLYRLPELLASPSTQVIVFEGEKCVDAARAILTIPCVTMAGGGNAVTQADWSPLAGRDVIVWPDNDKTGIDSLKPFAEAISAVGPKSLRYVEPPGDAKPPKWDVADAIVTDKWGRAEVLAWAKERVKPLEIVSAPARPAAKVVNLQGEEIDADQWRAEAVCTEDGRMKPRATVNFRVVIQQHMRKMFRWNEFSHTVFVAERPPWSGSADKAWRPRPLIENDIAQVCNFLERKLLAPRTAEALSMITVVAEENSYHPIRDYLSRLAWDGVPRLAGGMWEGESIQHMPAEYMGAPDAPIYGAFMRRWMISAVARIMLPGCKADCMIVLEGSQGAKKSSVLRTLSTVDGVEYFTDAIGDIESKDGLMQIQGIWIAEIAELNAFQRKEADAIKSWLSRSVDRFRPPFDRLTIDFPRQCVIAGTLNPTDGFLRDSTGARRFWPIPVRGPIDVGRVAEDRDQLWAEAVAAWRAGEQWHLTPEETAQAKATTDDRYEEEPLGQSIEDFLAQTPLASFTADDVYRALGLSNRDKSKAVAMQVASYLRRRGYVRRRGSRQGDYQPYIWTKGTSV